MLNHPQPIEDIQITPKFNLPFRATYDSLVSKLENRISIESDPIKIIAFDSILDAYHSLEEEMELAYRATSTENNSSELRLLDFYWRDCVDVPIYDYELTDRKRDRFARKAYRQVSLSRFFENPIILSNYVQGRAKSMLRSRIKEDVMKLNLRMACQYIAALNYLSP
jgi:hypothetical protein